MAVRIDISDITPSGPLDTFSTATITLTCYNETAEQIVIDHTQTRVFLEVRAPNEDEPLLIIDEKLRQRMLFARGLANKPNPISIMSESQASVTFDLANYYYPFMAGHYRLTPCFGSPERGIVRGEEVDVTVVAREPVQILEWYENPVFGTHHLLCRYFADIGDTKTSLRWLGMNRPLASFFVKPLIEPGAAMAPVPSVAAYYDVESLKPGFEKVLVWHGNGNAVHIRSMRKGEPEGPERVCQLASASRLHPYSFRLADGTVFFFTLDEHEAGKMLRGYRAGPDGDLSSCLEHPLDDATPRVVLGGGPDTIHLVSAGPPLTHTIFSHDGELAQKVEIGDCEGTAHYLYADLPADIIRALYLDPGERTIVTALESSFPSIREPSVDPKVAKARLAISKSDRFAEFDFLFDRASRLNILYSTQRRHLALYNSELGITRLAFGERAYFPRLLQGAVPGSQGSTLPFVGFFTNARGFRFYEAKGPRPWSYLRTIRV
jgi:hypothetical protein